MSYSDMLNGTGERPPRDLQLGDPVQLDVDAHAGNDVPMLTVIVNGDSREYHPDDIDEGLADRLRSKAESSVVVVFGNYHNWDRDESRAVMRFVAHLGQDVRVRLRSDDTEDFDLLDAAVRMIELDPQLGILGRWQALDAAVLAQQDLSWAPPNDPSTNRRTRSR